MLLRQRQLGRQRLRLWLQQQLRLQSQSLLLRFHKITSAPGQMARGVFHFAVFYRRLQDPQVLQKNLSTQKDQDHTAGDLPITTPAREITKVVQPMTVTAGRMSTFKNANVTPTANASMLVATAISSSCL